jgi:uncharacterized membrane protein YhaH (DUF805 family)
VASSIQDQLRRWHRPQDHQRRWHDRLYKTNYVGGIVYKTTNVGAWHRAWSSSVFTITSLASCVGGGGLTHTHGTHMRRKTANVRWATTSVAPLHLLCGSATVAATRANDRDDSGELILYTTTLWLSCGRGGQTPTHSSFILHTVRH